MAKPLTQSIFQPTDFDLFLDEIGLENLSPQARIQLVDRMHRAVEYAFMTRVFRELSLEKKRKILELMQEADRTGNEQPVNQFFETEVPDAETIMEEEIQKIKDDLRFSTASMQDSFESVMAELGLQGKLNTPDEMPDASPATKQEEAGEPKTVEPFPWEASLNPQDTGATTQTNQTTTPDANETTSEEKPGGNAPDQWPSEDSYIAPPQAPDNQDDSSKALNDELDSLNKPTSSES